MVVDVVASYGQAVGQELKRQDPEREDVDSLVDRLAAEELRGHVLKRARAITGLAEGGCVGHRQSKVDQLDAVLAVDQEIAGVDIVVDVPLGVQGRQPLGSLSQILHLLGGARRARLAHVLKAHAVDEFHDHEVLALVRRSIVKGAHDVGMHQVDGHLAFERARHLRPRRAPRPSRSSRAIAPSGRPCARSRCRAPVNARHAAARRLGNDREPALQVHARDGPVPRRPKDVFQLADHRLAFASGCPDPECTNAPQFSAIAARPCHPVSGHSWATRIIARPQPRRSSYLATALW